MMETVLLGLVGFGLGSIVFWVGNRLVYGSLRARLDAQKREAQAQRERILQEAELEAKQSRLEAEQAHEEWVQSQREALEGTEDELRQREREQQRRMDQLEQRESELRKSENKLRREERHVEKRVVQAEQRFKQASEELERVATLTKDEAKAELVQLMERDAQKEAARRIKEIVGAAEAEAQENAQRVIAGAIVRLASSFVAEKTVSVVELPSDEMKGRLIGREGRNIRAFEAVTGVDLIVDDTPEAVVLSSFNPVRRATATHVLERLVEDGRVHPARIEEVFEQVRVEMDEQLLTLGEDAELKAGLSGLHREILLKLGSLHYRVVNGQNVWKHSVETALIAGMMAAEIGADQSAAKRAGLLHDIGKSIDHEVEGNHAHVGATFAQRFGENKDVVVAIEQNHDPEPKTVLAVLVQAADALSKARPGARWDEYDAAIKRLDALESMAKAFDGVEDAFALQAGREIRVMVDFAKVSDDAAVVLSKDIARRIEEHAQHVGDIRVTVVRQARATEIAR